MIIAGMVAAAVISSLAQAYNSEKQRGADKKTLKKIEDMFSKIVPPEYDVSINDPPKYITEKLQDAGLDFSKVTPQEFKIVGQYAPEAAKYVAEANPTLVKGTAAQKEGRQAQIDALRSMQAEAKGTSPEFAIQLQRAKDAAQAQAQSRQQSILEDAQRRGLGGGGMTLAAQLAGAGQSMSQGAALSQQAALDAYKNKMNAMQQAGSMGRQLSADELSQEQSNADIINAFNTRTSRAYQDYLNQRAAMENQAQLANLNAQQNIANRNVEQANEAQRFNLQNYNQLAQQGYQNRVSERNYQNQLAQSSAQWAANEKDRQNQLKRQAYEDQMNKAAGMAGTYRGQMQSGQQATADRNAMIGALGSVAGSYYQGQAAEQARKDAQAAEDARLDKYLKARYPQNVSDNTQNYFTYTA